MDKKQQTKETYIERQYHLCRCSANLFKMYAELENYRAQRKKIDEVMAEAICAKYNITHELCCRMQLAVAIFGINYEIDNQKQ